MSDESSSTPPLQSVSSPLILLAEYYRRIHELSVWQFHILQLNDNELSSRWLKQWAKWKGYSPETACSWECNVGGSGLHLWRETVCRLWSTARVGGGCVTMECNYLRRQVPLKKMLLSLQWARNNVCACSRIAFRCYFIISFSFWRYGGSVSAIKRRNHAMKFFVTSARRMRACCHTCDYFRIFGWREIIKTTRLVTGRKNEG